ncbi:MAG: Gx transporter family protein [Bacilli bacterium]|nr:Gx transporter family protein [Bacilli bacterium]
MDIKKIVRLAMFLSLAIVLSILESFIPIFNGMIPGLKLGLANIVILVILYLYGFKDAIYISILRVIMVGMLRTGLFSITFFFSFSGAILSIIMMTIFKKISLFSVVGVSIIGSIFHSIGQVIIAIFLLNTPNMIYYLPYLLLFAIPSGIITGLISKELINRMKDS